MRNKALRQLEMLEKKERGNQQKRQSSMQTAAFLCWKVLLAHHLGSWNPDEEEDPGEAEARALNYESRFHYLESLFNGEIADINKRFNRARRGLFQRLGLGFARCRGNTFSNVFVRLVHELPQRSLQWLESNLQVSRNSRVFTQMGKAAFQRLTIPEHPLLSLIQREESRISFWAFRRYTRPGMKVGWWQYEVANQLQRFYYRLINGERPMLALMAPPQHGKTEQVTDFIAWIAGKKPEWKTIFASYSDELGLGVNKALQRIMRSEAYTTIFGCRLGESGSDWPRNNKTFEYPNHRGAFYNTTVEGQITGKRLDVGIVDDPIKGRAEANRKSVRDKVWEWFTDDFLTRFSDTAGLIMIMTRWHVDDPLGRFIERFPEATILCYPAVAEEDEKNRRKGGDVVSGAQELIVPHAAKEGND